MTFSLKEQFEGFIRTPEIFAENNIFEYPLFKTDARVNGLTPAQLTEPDSRVLGKRMEHFFSYYITHFTPFEIIAQNEQVILEKKTLGELDFLLKQPASEKVLHVELIFKYYLFDPNTGTSEKEHLIGPNRRDSLNQKLVRLQEKQFPLLFDPATEELLHSLQINPANVLQKMCFKAFVFLPKIKEEISFSEINRSTIAGYWIKFEDFTAEAYEPNLFFSPKKKYWPVAPELNKTWLSYSETLEQVEAFMEKELSLLLWMKSPSGEIERFFVVWW